MYYREAIAKQLVLNIIKGLVLVEQNGGFFLQSQKLGFWLNSNWKYQPIYDCLLKDKSLQKDINQTDFFRHQIRTALFLVEINKPFFNTLMLLDNYTIQSVELTLTIEFSFSIIMWGRKIYLHPILYEELLFLRNTLKAKNFK